MVLVALASRRSFPEKRRLLVSVLRILSGFGIGIVYNTLLSLAVSCFPDKKVAGFRVVLTGLLSTL